MMLSEKFSSPVDVLLTTMTHRQIAEYQAYYQLQDPEYKERLIQQDMTDEQRSDAITHLLTRAEDSGH